MLHTTNYGSQLSSMTHGMHGQAGAKQLAKELLSSADSNGDGKISKTEFESLMKNAAKSDATSIDNLFAYLDNNSDGSVSSQETTDAISALVDQMRGHVLQAGMQFNPLAAEAVQKHGSGVIDTDGDDDAGRGESIREASEHEAAQAMANASGSQSSENSSASSQRLAFLIQGLLHQYQENQANAPAQTSSLLSTSA